MLIHSSRSMDGLTLLMSSSDGFCSALIFAPGELGQVYTGAVPPPPMHHLAPLQSTSSSAQTTPNPTPTTAQPTPIPIPRQSANTILSTLSPLPVIRPASPTRSNSASSIATQSSLAPNHAHTHPIPNPRAPTPTIPPAQTGTATTSLPLTTPPQTPMSVTVLGKRDSAIVSESEQETDENQGTAAKKRKIAPTLVSAGTGGHKGTEQKQQ